MSKFCSNCGQQLNDEKFCPNCGTAQEVEQQNQMQQPTPEVAPVYNQVPVKKKKGAVDFISFVCTYSNSVHKLIEYYDTKPKQYKHVNL